MTGSISTYEHGVDFVVEWMIASFSTLEVWDDTGYCSPVFSFGGERWCLLMYLSGSSFEDSSGHMDLRLVKSITDRSIRQSFSLSLKTAEGNKYNEEHYTKDFDYYDIRVLFNRVISSLELSSRRSELVPDDVLTVVCTMKRSTSDGSERNDPEHANVGESSQHMRPPTQSVRPSTQSVRPSALTVEASTQTVEVKCEACTSGFSIGPHNDELHRDLKELFLNKEDCDVILKVKDSEFPAHRLILKARSPVFASTFRHDMENATGIVEIDDCKPSSFSDFLCFLYCADATVISRENVIGLFMAADKYQVLNLRAKCLEFMKQNLSVDTFCETLTLALRHSEAELIGLCTDYFKQNIPKIIVTVKWQTFLAKNPTESNELLVRSFVPNSS